MQQPKGQIEKRKRKKLWRDEKRQERWAMECEKRQERWAMECPSKWCTIALCTRPRSPELWK